MEEVANLSLIQGRESQVFRLAETTSIGRAPTCTISLTGAAVARHHATVERTESGQFRVVDHDTTSGTYVNGQQIRNATLRETDKVSIGGHVLVFSGHERLITADIVLSDQHEPDGHRWFSFASSTGENGAPAETDLPSEWKSPSSSQQQPPSHSELDTPQHFQRKLRLIQELAQHIGLFPDTDDLLTTMLDSTLRSFGAERGAILLVNDEGEMTARLGRRASRAETSLVLSKTIINEVIARRASVLSMDASADPRFSLSKSVEIGRIRSTISAPMLHQGDLLGIIHLDSPMTGVFQAADLEILTSVASQAAIAVKNAMFTQRIARMRAEEQARERRSAQQEQLASVGRLAASVAHEINNPLTYVLTNLSFAIAELRQMMRTRSDVDLNGIVEALDEANEGADRVQGVVRDLKTLSRVTDVGSPTDIGRILDTSINVARGEIRHRAKLSRSYEHHGLVRANAARLGQVFLNLIVNAAQSLDAAPSRDAHTIGVRTWDSDDGHVLIEISDTGPGIPEDIRDQIFEPFFTTKAATGTGLGLYVTRNIVTEFGGTIEVECPASGGTIFRISFPSTSIERTEDLPDLRSPKPQGTTTESVGQTTTTSPEDAPCSDDLDETSRAEDFQPTVTIEPEQP
ncbi:MAG: GAF domain-containing protein [Deltaproteobacteria bacterium]|nr:GAF domain-containing protein [Deltaproteobacteria bacterium]